MKQIVMNRGQRGLALVVSLLFLMVVTILSLAAASNSSLGLKMSANMQDAYESFQAAEAGIYAALGLAGSGHDPFVREDVVQPFAAIAADDHPLRGLRDGADKVAVEVALLAVDRDCPRPPSESGGSSVGLFDCDYYRIKSEHDVDSKARTRVELGVVKTVIGESG
ncbi:pilus assembly PilX family protein [Kineobactrum salinum]|uniref:Type 4 fimbrial biogenesis protein PilX N-terminal domain-containing protein n=1 Tax=Kineobactrum salinum TaxID=2708301 RepID=A0A6C0TZI6_9GAMM|nr:PilX N-terminal domain-containing pilus assembly protein [Kineobactrum salinum]QIB64779.1 hypothetical protein G3T16_04635 [Kineobactrum salinum]